MKIVVAHPGTQYVKNLLIALAKKQLLVHFFTSFASNKLEFLLSFLPSALRKKLNRYYLPKELGYLTTHFPRVFFRYKTLKRLNSIMSINDEFERKVIKKLASIDYDCIIGYENSTLKLFREAKKRGKITILDLAQIHHKDIQKISEPFYTPEIKTFEKTMVNPYKQEALKYTDYIFTLSTFATESLVFNQILPQKIFKVNLGVDLKLFCLKKQYNIGNKPFEFLFVGTIMRRKGLDLLLKVWQDLKLVNCKLSLVGPISDGKNILEIYGEIIEYHSFLPHSELVNKYQQADVFVFPSYLDSWAQTVIEAMACGTPVIVSENTGAKDAVKQGGGFVIPVDDPIALKEKILYFYHNRSEIERMGREAHRIAQQYSWENYHQQVLAALSVIATRENLPQ